MSWLSHEVSEWVLFGKLIICSMAGLGISWVWYIAVPSVNLPELGGCIGQQRYTAVVASNSYLQMDLTLLRPLQHYRTSRDALIVW